MNKLLYLGVAALLVAGCGNLEDDDYFNSNTVRNENADILSTDATVSQYIQGRSDLSQMSALFQQQGIYEQMPLSGEKHTVLVVANDHFQAPEAEEAEKVAKSHVTNIEVSPSRSTNRLRAAISLATCFSIVPHWSRSSRPRMVSSTSSAT